MTLADVLCAVPTALLLSIVSAVSLTTILHRCPEVVGCRPFIDVRGVFTGILALFNAIIGLEICERRHAKPTQEGLYILLVCVATIILVVSANALALHLYRRAHRSVTS